MADILRERVFAIACGYPDANDPDDLRKDPAFKMACGRLPESGDDLASQPTMSSLENAPDLRTLIRMSHGLVDLWCGSYKRPPKSITLDIDDTADTVHGHQQMSLFNAQNGVRYIFGLGSNAILAGQIFPELDQCCVRRATGKLDVVRDYAEIEYAAKSWSHPRRVVARIEVTRKGADVRYIITNLTKGTPQWLYDHLYCARGQAENLIKRHKSQLASDRTSCRSPLANQMRLILHTAAHWLMRTVRDAIPKPQPLASVVEDRGAGPGNGVPGQTGVRRQLSGC